MRPAAICGAPSVIAVATSSVAADPMMAREFSSGIRDGEIRMADLVDIAIPANGQTAAEALGLKVHRSVTTGARVRQIPREEAEIAVECLRDWGVSARILESASARDEPASERGTAPASETS